MISVFKCLLLLFTISIDCGPLTYNNNTLTELGALNNSKEFQKPKALLNNPYRSHNLNISRRFGKPRSLNISRRFGQGAQNGTFNGSKVFRRADAAAALKCGPEFADYVEGCVDGVAGEAGHRQEYPGEEYEQNYNEEGNPGLAAAAEEPATEPGDKAEGHTKDLDGPKDGDGLGDAADLSEGKAETGDEIVDTDSTFDDAHVTTNAPEEEYDFNDGGAANGNSSKEPENQGQGFGAATPTSHSPSTVIIWEGGTSPSSQMLPPDVANCNENAKCRFPFGYPTNMFLDYE